MVVEAVPPMASASQPAAGAAVNETAVAVAVPPAAEESVSQEATGFVTVSTVNAVPPGSVDVNESV